jgi:ribosomal-protein-alanine N-acetyltransferase
VEGSFVGKANGIHMSAVADTLDSNIRLMTEKDFRCVIDIEERAYSFPWTAGIFRDCLRAGCVAWVYESNQDILGYGILTSGGGEGHILNLCVDPDYQHQGVGSTLLRALLATAEVSDIATLFLEVRPSNKAALGLYEKFGFNEVGIRNNYYPAENGREDAVVLAKELKIRA